MKGKEINWMVIQAVAWLVAVIHCIILMLVLAVASGNYSERKAALKRSKSSEGFAILGEISPV